MNRRSFLKHTAVASLLTRPFRETWLDRQVVDWMNRFQAIYTL